MGLARIGQGSMTLDLSRRQREVLIAYIQTGSYRQTAQQLGINEATARTRIAFVLRKNGWHSIAQAAYRLGTEENAA
jgi:DNA-binding NarL/FixJ family response regulator